MTTEEFDREFDILYNNIMSNTAPSIDQYEKSVFLTKAQEDVVVALYTGTFEGSEQLTESLKTLVKTVHYNSINDNHTPNYKNEKHLDLVSKNKSQLFELGDDVLFIIYESLTTNTGIEIPVRPVKHDEYLRISRNPFKRARKNEALRVVSNQDVVGGTYRNYLEIISVYDDYIYKVRYIRKPKPIILYDKQEGLTINGVDSRTECELPDIIHRTILDVAVKLATAAYKQ